MSVVVLRSSLYHSHSNSCSDFKFHFQFLESDSRHFTLLFNTMASTSYEAQLKIRRDAEELNRAHEELGLWMDGIGNSRSKLKPFDTKARVTSVKEKSTTLVNDETKIPSNQSRYEEERLRGNNYFQQGKYEDAISCYTRCLGEKDALASPLVYSNRGKILNDAFHPHPQRHDLTTSITSYSSSSPAMAHLKLKYWTQAESDATLALEIDNLHYKSYQRRCVARLSMGKIRAAMMDVCSAQDCYEMEMKTKFQDDNTSKITMNEMKTLRDKVDKALVEAARRAPRRKLPLTVL